MIEPYAPKADVYPYYPAFLDIETNPSGEVIGIGFAYYLRGRQYHAYAGWGEWLRHFRQLARSVSGEEYNRLFTIYAHNGASFDWLSFVRYCEQHETVETFRYIASGSAGIGMDVRLKGFDRDIHLRDSIRLLPGSLADLCRTFQTEHQKINLDEALPESIKRHVDTTKVLPHEIKALDEVLFWQYLENDVKAGQEMLYGFWKMIYELEGSIDDLPMTLPSLAMRLWRKTLTKPIYVTTNKNLREFERRAYSGGRTQCFRGGIYDSVRVYDINSQYPAVMRSGTYPVSYKGGWVRHYCGDDVVALYEGDFRQTNTNVPAILRDEQSGEFVYSGSGVYTHAEVARIRTMGEFTVKRGYVYVETGNPFVGFIDKWYGLKLEAERNGDTALRFVAKILMNSLYGKFGQRDEQWTLLKLTRDETIQLMAEGVNIRHLGGYVLKEEKRISDFTFCAIAAYVTSYARLLLLDYMDACYTQGGKVIYCDTDSVHCTETVLPSSDSLGDVKLEYEGEGAYAGRKLYGLKEGKINKDGTKSAKLVHKGVISDKDRLSYKITYDDMKRFATDPRYEVEIRQQNFPTPKEVLSGKAQPAIMVTRKRTLRNTYERKENPGEYTE